MRWSSSISTRRVKFGGIHKVGRHTTELGNSWLVDSRRFHSVPRHEYFYSHETTNENGWVETKTFKNTPTRVEKQNTYSVATRWGSSFRCTDRLTILYENVTHLDDNVMSTFFINLHSFSWFFGSCCLGLPWKNRKQIICSTFKLLTISQNTDYRKKRRDLWFLLEFHSRKVEQNKNKNDKSHSRPISTLHPYQ